MQAFGVWKKTPRPVRGAVWLVLPSGVFGFSLLARCSRFDLSSICGWCEVGHTHQINQTLYTNMYVYVYICIYNILYIYIYYSINNICVYIRGAGHLVLACLFNTPARSELLAKLRESKELDL